MREDDISVAIPQGKKYSIRILQFTSIEKYKKKVSELVEQR
jgi:hypothetical protein